MMAMSQTIAAGTALFVDSLVVLRQSIEDAERALQSVNRESSSRKTPSEFFTENRQESCKKIELALNHLRGSLSQDGLHETVDWNACDVKPGVEKIGGAAGAWKTGLHDDVNVETPLCVTIANRSLWRNVQFNFSSGLTMIENPALTVVSSDLPASLRKIKLMVQVMTLMKNLIRENSYCTKRDLYYQDPALFGSQSCLDSILEDISLMLKIPRWNLHVVATSKGLIAGDLQFIDSDGNYIDCRHTDAGVLVPSQVHKIKDLHTRGALYVLVIEKDATFQKLLADKYISNYGPCIIITGKGYPDVSTRMMVKLMWITLHLPTFVLVDADPHGIEIMSVYKFGSMSMCSEAEYLTVPLLKWLGIHPSDINRLRIPQRALMPITKSDELKAKSLLSRAYITDQPYWKQEYDVYLLPPCREDVKLLLATGRASGIKTIRHIARMSNLSCGHA